MALSTVVVMRHGESTWTDASVNRFAGWVDVPLTERGRAQAAHAGALLKSAGLRPDVCFTSLLRRSIVSAQIALDAVDRLWVPTERTWRLNERHYGAFQGQTRPAMRERYGEKLFSAYRRSFDVRPPEIDAASPYFQGHEDDLVAAGEAAEFDDIHPRAVAPLSQDGDAIHATFICKEPKAVHLEVFRKDGGRVKSNRGHAVDLHRSREDGRSVFKKRGLKIWSLVFRESKSHKIHLREMSSRHNCKNKREICGMKKRALKSDSRNDMVS